MKTSHIITRVNSSKRTIESIIQESLGFIRDPVYIKRSLGKNGVPIDVYKLRTMIPNAEGDLEGVATNGYDRHGRPKQDYRVTGRLGKLLRKYWLDELPQAYNWLVQRNIKFVGIRPMMEQDWNRYPPELMEEALQQKPGWFGVQYAEWKDLEEDEGIHMRKLRRYLALHKAKPITTDIRYFSNILYHIFFKGVRSG